MRKLLLLLFLLPVLESIAQTDTITLAKKKEPSIATIHTMDGKKLKGWFYRMDTDNVYLFNKGTKKSQLMNIKKADPYNEPVGINASKINTIMLNKKNTGLKVALIGLGAGAIIGAIIGYSNGDDPPGFLSFNAAEKAQVGAILGGLTGAITGAIIGALAKKVFAIGGNKDTYRDLHSELAQRLNIQ